MDFFQAQDAARGRTRTLVVLFAAAVVGIIAAVYVVVQLAWVGTGGRGPVFDPVLFAIIAAGTGLLVGAGSAFRTLELRSGGPSVARLLGGRPVPPDTTDPAERRLFNVVEEMAIASGTPVPAVFVLDHESGINAFAAGYTIHDAAVAVTRGTLERLDRDELQGVVAHEFSHILNGDMRLNIRLIGLLFGILLLAVVGRGLLRGGRFSSRGRKGGGQIALVGLALIVVGYIGVFFGRLIQAAVSRQREYLADAAAVQFTRNPDGLAGALKKIGGATAVGGSAIQDHHAEELSHLFFAEGVRPAAFTGLLRTHPPLDQRIRRIQPGWDGRYIVSKPATSPLEPPAPAGPPGAWAATRAGVGALGARWSGGQSGAMIALGAAAVMHSIGSPTPAHVEHAARLLRELPDELRVAAHEALGARAVVCALLLSTDAAVAADQWSVIREYGGPELVAEIERIAPLVAAQPAEMRLPLLDLSLPALRPLPAPEAAALREAVHRLVRADGRVRIFDFALIQVLERQLEGPEARPEAKYGERTVHSLVPLRPPAEIGGAGELAEALAALGRADRGVRRRFLDACAHCIAHDGRVRRSEAELFRAISESLDIPTPPMLPG